MKAQVIILNNPQTGAMISMRLFLKQSDASDYFAKLEEEGKHRDAIWGRADIEGFESYLETHYEVVQAITIEHMKDEPKGAVKERHDAQGHGGLYELAEELTDKFEKENEFTQWDGEFFDVMEKFTNENLK